MKRIVSSILSIALLAMLTFSAVATTSSNDTAKNVEISQIVSDADSAAIVGGSWAQFINGIACGAGIVAIAGGALSGVGAAVALAGVTSVAASCVSAFS